MIAFAVIRIVDLQMQENKAIERIVKEATRPRKHSDIYITEELLFLLVSVLDLMDTAYTPLNQAADKVTRAREIVSDYRNGKE